MINHQSPQLQLELQLEGRDPNAKVAASYWEDAIKREFPLVELLRLSHEEGDEE